MEKEYTEFKNIFLLISWPDFAPLRQLKKLNSTVLIANSFSILDLGAEMLAPISRKLLLRLNELTLNPNAYVNLPKDLRRLCVNVKERVKSRHSPFSKIFPKTLRSLCLHVKIDTFCGTKFFASLHAHLPELQRLAVTDHCTLKRVGSLDGETILRYLKDAENLIEMRLYSVRFDGIELSEFYDRALEIIEKRESKLKLEIYHQGRTIVGNNSSLKLLQTDEFWSTSDNKLCAKRYVVTEYTYSNFFCNRSLIPTRIPPAPFY